MCFTMTRVDQHRERLDHGVEEQHGVERIVALRCVCCQSPTAKPGNILNGRSLSALP